MKTKMVEYYMNSKNPKAVFAVAVGAGRKKTFEKFKLLVEQYAPEVDVVAHFDEKGEGCGTARSYLFHKLRDKYDMIISVDDDIEITEGWYKQVIEAYHKFPKVNMFTTMIMQEENVYTSGTYMSIERNILTMIHNNKNLRKKYLETDFAPGGCMIFCREALKKFNPIPIPICEDYEWYCQWIKLGLGKITTINKAILKHNVKDNPRVPGFRSPKNIMNSCKLIYIRHGYTFIADENTPKYHCGLTDEEGIEDFMREANKMIEKNDKEKIPVNKKMDKKEYIKAIKELEVFNKVVEEFGGVREDQLVIETKESVQSERIARPKKRKISPAALDNSDITYLISNASNSKLLDVCLGSISKYTPAETLLATLSGFRIRPEAFMWLFDKCSTDIGIFIDDDAFITNDITPLINLIRDGSHSLVGFTYRNQAHIDAKYFMPNFLIMNVKEFKEEFGVKGIQTDIDLAEKDLGVGEGTSFMSGISQKLNKCNTRILSFSASPHYEFAGVLSDEYTPYVLHLWYGAWKRRYSPEGDMTKRDNEINQDFLDNNLRI